ncbi:hypothetical protein DRO29_07165 [Candidatus Bathyarchaeota archaeon]|mgnify:CR=1 FL=1|nr:MAG: hypothetical protein DRO29_07165 [Candidatus Bathyarchaeota archaeon]HDM91797.1 DUF131 domain-containing protein [Candidatus Korarchaeota archaeon]
MNELQTLGLVVLCAGVLLVILSLLLPPRAERREVRETSVGGIILIGPIPIVFGRNLTRGMLLLLMVTGLVMVITLLALYAFWGG